jgi:hypothetical protein
MGHTAYSTLLTGASKLSVSVGQIKKYKHYYYRQQ